MYILLLESKLEIQWHIWKNGIILHKFKWFLNKLFPYQVKIKNNVRSSIILHVNALYSRGIIIVEV